MPTTKLYNELLTYMKEITTLSTCASTLGWDQRTYMPFRAADHRADQLALLSRLIHQKLTSPVLGDLLHNLESSVDPTDSTSDFAVNLREWKRLYFRSQKLPVDFVEEFSKTTAQAEMQWMLARKENRFNLFKPWLEKIVTLVQQQASYYGYTDHPYDALLDEYEPAMTTKQLKAIFTPLTQELTNLMEKILGSNFQPNISILKRSCSIIAQKEFCELLSTFIGFDFSRGRLDISTHPFTTQLGPMDIRLTTRYQETDLADSIFSTLHETGHGIYEQGLPSLYFGTPMAEAVSLGIHESQSRLWENFVGRRLSSWKFFYPYFQKQFKNIFEDVSLEELYFAINYSHPSLIRTESDEVTYNLHIALRFELEEMMITGQLKIADLPEAWNAGMKKYLKITVPSDTLGCLQDMHWGGGALGYFPTYTLGNLFAAQFFHTAQQEISNLDQAFETGKFNVLKQWLNEKIHVHGKRYNSNTLCQLVTQKPLDRSFLINYLKEKYSLIYHL